MSEINCTNCFPVFSIELPSYEKVKTSYCAQKAVSLASEGCRKAWQATQFVVTQTISIVALAIAKLIITIKLSPLIFLLPPANTLLSERLITIISLTLTLPTILFRIIIQAALPPLNITFSHGNQGTANVSEYVAVGFSEEIVFRGLIQQKLLRELPKKVLNKFAPNYVDLVDHKVARVARVVFASILFAAAHAPGGGNASGMLLPQFMGGLFYGTLVESYDYSITKVSLIHATYDVFIVTILGGF